MKNTNSQINDQFKAFADLQTKSLEQILPFAAQAADATSMLLRKNYEVMGDLVEFTVGQSKLPATGVEPSEVAAAHMEATKKLSETMNARAAEYVEMAKGWGEQAQDATAKATKAKTKTA